MSGNYSINDHLAINNKEKYDGITKIDPVTILINDEPITHERKAYINNFKFLLFSGGLSESTDFLLDDTLSIEMHGHKLPFNKLPSNLKYLRLTDYDYDINCLPLNLEEFVLENPNSVNGQFGFVAHVNIMNVNNTEQLPKINFPHNLKKIRLTGNSEHIKLKRIFPDCVECLDYNQHFFTQNKYLVIPTNINELYCNGTQDMIINNNKLKKMYINNSRNENMENNIYDPNDITEHEYKIDLSQCINLNFLSINNKCPTIVYNDIILPDNLKIIKFIGENFSNVTLNQIMIKNLLFFKG